jgi:radical SAM superfamily enzyme YgiQ (UPF0313 family)
MKKKIVLINPPRYEPMPLHTLQDLPYGLLKIGGYHLEQGHDVTLINCLSRTIDLREKIRDIKCGNYENEGIVRPVFRYGMGPEEIEEKLREIENPDEIWITSTMTYYWECVHEVIDIAKKVYPNCPVFLGGIYASICRDNAQNSKADYIHYGPYLPAENSRTALELLEQIPDYFIIKYSRGCPHNCSYCAVSKLEGHKMTFMDNEAFVSELEEKYHIFGIKNFSLWESNLLVDAKNKFEKVLDEIIARKLPIGLKFPEGLQPSLIYPELAIKMKKAGVKNFSLPLESSDESMYDRFHKPSSLKQFDRAVRIFKDVGFKPHQIKTFVLVGMPNQTIESIVLSDFKAMAMQTFLLNLKFTPIPGTEEYEKNKDKLKDKSLGDLHPNAYPFAHPGMTVKDLEIIGKLNKSTNLYMLVTLRDSKPKEAFKKLIKQHLVNIDDASSKECADIQILNTTNTKEDKDIYKLLNTIRNIKSQGKYYAVYKPLPKCKLKDRKSRAEFKELPSSCKKCLLLFTEGCKFHELKSITDEDIKDSYDIYKKDIKKKCLACIHYRRGNCRMLCAQIKENENR